MVVWLMKVALVAATARSRKSKMRPLESDWTNSIEGSKLHVSHVVVQFYIWLNIFQTILISIFHCLICSLS